LHLSSDGAERRRPPKFGKPSEKRFADEARFIRRWFENPGTTGAVSPSSPFLARAMAAKVDTSLPGPIVELGPGTGPVTQALLRRGVPPERLVLVEFDPNFCRLLERRFPGVHVVHGDAYRLDETLRGVLEEPAAAIVSGLPLLNTPEPRRHMLLAEAFRLMQPTGVFVQFTYGVMSPIPRKTKRGHKMSFEAKSSAPIWLNLPPARIWTYRRSAALPTRPPTSGQIFLMKMREGAERFRGGFKEQTARLGSDFHARATEEAERAPVRIAREHQDVGRSFYDWSGGPS
jgi:phosphatidylethanolamine/phosphatidyl-N-methylethanolamine N-methyltransferase